MSGWSATRLVIYVASCGAAVLAFLGMADFNWQTGDFDLHPVNIYDLASAAGGVLSSLLASIALWRGWGSK